MAENFCFAVDNSGDFCSKYYALRAQTLQNRIWIIVVVMINLLLLATKYDTKIDGIANYM